MPDVAAQPENVEYDRGFKDAMDRRRMYVSVGAELAMPIDWADYTDEEERETVAAIVEMQEYQSSFRTNMIRQAMLKWRQARLHENVPEKMQMLIRIGNAIMELVAFYDHAKDSATPKVDTDDHGYNSLLTEL